MATFYDEWLRYWDEEEEERARARTIVHENEQEWIKTKYDHRAALLCSPQNGFATSGTVMMGEIPRRCHTGKHSHGEEAIFILEGEGFTVIDGKRYDWDARSCVFMPFGSVHQHFNTGENTVRYISAQALPLERFAGLAKVVHYEDAGETPRGGTDGFERADSDFDPEWGRIILRAKDAPVTEGEEQTRMMAQSKDEFHAYLPKEMKTPGQAGHHAGMINLMWGDTGFKAKEISLTAILVDEPGKHGGKHSHMEAVLYVLEGEGYSIIEGERVTWKKGTTFQVQGPDTVHQHFPTGNVNSQMLRIHYGLRSHYYQAIARRVFPYSYFELSSYAE